MVDTNLWTYMQAEQIKAIFENEVIFLTLKTIPIAKSKWF